jgi:hypothetical protein
MIYRFMLSHRLVDFRKNNNRLRFPIEKLASKLGSSMFERQFGGL